MYFASGRRSRSQSTICQSVSDQKKKLHCDGVLFLFPRFSSKRFLFRKVKSSIKGTHFSSIEDVKTKSKKLLKDLPKLKLTSGNVTSKESIECRRVNAERNYFKDNNIVQKWSKYTENSLCSASFLL